MTRLAFILLGLALVSLGTLARADTVIAAGTIRGQSLIMASDGAIAPGDTPGALSDPAALSGRMGAPDAVPSGLPPGL